MSTAWPRSSASSCVSSTGNPNVVASSKRLAPGDGIAPVELVEDLLTTGERLAEPLLLEPDDALDLRAVLPELRVGVAHLVADDTAEPVDAVEADPLAVLDGATDDPAADVAASFVRRRHAVGDEEGHRAAVICEHAVSLGRDGIARRRRPRTRSRPSP